MKKQPNFVKPEMNGTRNPRLTPLQGNELNAEVKELIVQVREQREIREQMNEIVREKKVIRQEANSTVKKKLNLG